MSATVELFDHNAQQEVDVCSSYGRSLESFEEDVEAVREWAKTQPHLPEVPRKLCGRRGSGSLFRFSADELIGSFLRGSKCSVERAKQRVDMYYTLRGVIPDIFQHPLSEEVQEQKKYL